MKLPHSTSLNLAAGRASARERAAKSDADRLQEIAAFGSNPGALRAWSYVPPGLKAKAPLVVVLHGCSQSAADYDTAAGWSELADEQGFALLFPAQRRANNPNRCFNWFSPIDSRRDSGEALSIRQMIAWMAQAHPIDERQVFVNGLSAGGAMTSIMLAAYPEVFAGGAIIAGLPFGAAASVSDAFARMAGSGYPADTELAALVRDACAYDGPWPRISVWHGSADTTVDPSNAGRIVAQWCPLQGVSAGSFEQEQTGALTRRTWRNDASQAVIEQNIITGMGHGTPLQTQGAEACGKAGSHALEVGISSTREIAKFWGLAGRTARPVIASPPATGAMQVQPKSVAIPKIVATALRRTPASHPLKGVGAVIEDALRAAGLMK